MSRDGGFRNADIDVLFAHDPKITMLRAERPAEWCGYALAYLETVLSSWRIGRRVRVADALLPGMPADAPEVLAQYGLLEADGRVLEATWDSWYGPAARRRELLRERVARHRGGGTLNDLVKAFPGGR